MIHASLQVLFWQNHDSNQNQIHASYTKSIIIFKTALFNPLLQVFLSENHAFNQFKIMLPSQNQLLNSEPLISIIVFLIKCYCSFWKCLLFLHKIRKFICVVQSVKQNWAMVGMFFHKDQVGLHTAIFQ